MPSSSSKYEALSTSELLQPQVHQACYNLAMTGKKTKSELRWNTGSFNMYASGFLPLLGVEALSVAAALFAF